MSSLAHGTLILSIDLEFAGRPAGLAEQRALDETVEQLLAVLADHDMPATWAAADPAVSAARSNIETCGGKHEMAILGDSSWVGQAAGRSRFARELARRVGHARSGGLQVAALVLKNELPGEHSDLAIKEGIVAVRQGGLAPATRHALPRTLRFGLWDLPATLTLPGTSRWLPGGGGARTARYEIDQAIEQRSLVHLAVDAPQVAARGPRAVRVVESIVEHAARRAGHGLLTIATMSAVAMVMARENRGQPSRSILRPAA